jgi:hypothetical protein
MAGLLDLGNKDNAPEEERPTTSALFVKGTRFDNTAAKFWPGLVDEVFEKFPFRPAIELSALSSDDLARRHLFPELDMQRDMDRMIEKGETLEDVLAELDITGPPAPVRLRLLRAGKVVFEQALPEDCLDAETFPCLLVWLLEWSGVPDTEWNTPRQKGVFRGDDRQRHRSYAISYTIVTNHVKEGLLQRTVTLAAVASEDG